MKRWLTLAGILLFVGTTLAANAPKGGTLKVDSPGLVLTLKAGTNRLTGKPAEVPVPPLKEIPLPAGSYDVASVALCAQDAARQVWTLTSAGQLGSLKSIEVTEGQTTTVSGGQALSVKATLTGKQAGLPAGANVTVLLRYVGKAGEVYDPKVMKGRSPGPAPAIRIVDENGGLLSEGLYKFGSTGGG